jgi:beta-lactamase class A
MAGQQKQTIENLQEQVTLELQKGSGLFAVAFKDMATGKTVLINEKISFHAASTMKTPVLIELFKQASEGKFSMNDSVVIKNSFKSIVDGSEFTLDSADDSQVELYRQIGQKQTIAFLAYQMIIASSNLATNMMIELVKAENVMKTMKATGVNDIQVLRGVEDNKAFEKGLNNTTTAFDQMLIFEKMAQYQLVSRKACKKMIEILLHQKFNEVIPAQLPAGVKVAHKTGSITGIQHDAGIVFLPGGKKYVLVLLSKFEGDEKKAQQTMANVSRLLYDYVVSQ